MMLFWDSLTKGRFHKIKVQVVIHRDCSIQLRPTPMPPFPQQKATQNVGTVCERFSVEREPVFEIDPKLSVMTFSKLCY